MTKALRPLGANGDGLRIKGATSKGGKLIARAASDGGHARWR
jgi:hypothetical protein